MIDCATQGCFTPAVPRSRWCSAHALQLQRVRGYMTEAEIGSSPTTPTTAQATAQWDTSANSFAINSLTIQLRAPCSHLSMKYSF